MTYRQNTSWGGRAHNTSWGGRAVRSMALLAGLTVTFPIASAALPAVAQASEHVVVVGPDAARAALAVGAIDTRTLVPGVATAQVSPAGAAALAGRGLRVAANSRVQLDSALSFSEGGDASGSQGDNPSDANAWGDSTAGDSRRHDPTASPDGRLSVHTITRAGEIGSGAGETIAVIDSGVDEVPGLAGRVIQGIDLTGSGPQDAYGHGTFVASLAAGDGTGADGRHTGIVGVAPAARILSVKVADSQGRSTVGQVVAGLAWVIAHRGTFGIDVVNLSLSVKKTSSYNSDPVDALAEAAWFSGIVVVASSGNDGGNVDSAPGNDPFVLTVGSSYDANTVTPADDSLSPYSDAGVTQDGVGKPEVTVTGEHVQAALPGDSTLAADQTVTGLPDGYGQLSGTSMAAGVASGVVALLLAEHPDWTPDQVKRALAETRLDQAGGELSAVAAAADSPAPGPQPFHPSFALAVAYAQQVLHTTAYASVTWSEVTWSDVTWSDVTWSNVTWSDAVKASGTSADVTWSDVTWSDSTSSSSSSTSSTSAVTWSNVTWSDVTWSD